MLDNTGNNMVIIFEISYSGGFSTTFEAMCIVLFCFCFPVISAAGPTISRPREILAPGI